MAHDHAFWLAGAATHEDDKRRERRLRSGGDTRGASPSALALVFEKPGAVITNRPRIGVRAHSFSFLPPLGKPGITPLDSRLQSFGSRNFHEGYLVG